MKLHPRLSSLTGILGVLTLWTTIPFAMYKAGLRPVDARPLSYLGVAQSTQLLFSLSLVISSVLFILFGFYVWRHYRTGKRFIVYLVLGQTGQILAALFPNTTGSPTKIVHTFAAFGLAISLPLLIREFARSQTRSRDYRAYRKLFRLQEGLFVLGIGLFIFTMGVAPLSEMLPALGFHAWIIYLTIFSDYSISDDIQQEARTAA